MNMQIHSSKIVSAVAALLFAGACTLAPSKPDGAVTVREKLTQLQADPQLAGRAPVAMKDAEVAVRTAEMATDDVALGQHRVVVADRKVDTARAQAQSRYAEDQRKTLAEQREAARLEARTREADNAKRDARSARSDASAAQRQATAARTDASAARTDASAARGEASTAQAAATTARSDADTARTDAAIARDQADSARKDTAAAQQQSADLQMQIVELNAKATDRGLVVTLGDVLFATGGTALKGGVTGNLNKLGAFLNKYPERTVLIEGHTDSVGSAESNVALSQRRADSVKAYLVAQGVSPGRLAASGKGEGSPTADNESVTGRQQNRRVEVIISNTVASR